MSRKNSRENKQARRTFRSYEPGIPGIWLDGDYQKSPACECRYQMFRMPDGNMDLRISRCGDDCEFYLSVTGKIKELGGQHTDFTKTHGMEPGPYREDS